MSDPVGERLRSYYQSIQGDASTRLEARVARALDSTPAPLPARAPWRPAFGLAIVGVAILIVALAVRELVPAPTPSPSAVTGPSASPASSSSPQPTATQEPTASPTPVQPTPTPAQTSTATPSSFPTPTALTSHFDVRGSLTVGRDGPTATLLEDGRVLIAGGKVAHGLVSAPTASAELYNPSTGKFSATGSMAAARWGHTATLLQDGRVLIAGGADLSDGADNLRSAELYDPSTGKFAPTGSMAVGRADQTATLLADGRVLIAGGTNSIGLDSAEIYDPATGTFSATGSMTTARQGHTATLLKNGLVLIAGGTANGKVGPFGPLASAELYNPAIGQFTATGSMAEQRAGPTAALLEDGRVLVSGGVDQGSPAFSSAELYDPTTGQFSATGSRQNAFLSFTATLLPDGRVLEVGRTVSAAATTAELYDPTSGKFSSGGTTNRVLDCDTATLLADGSVLLVGGATNGPNGTQPLATAVLYRP